MVPGVGGGELILIAVVALVVVGPKDLPKLLRQAGKFVGKMRRMADEFKTSFDDMARQTELDELRKEVEALRTGQSVPLITNVNQQMTAISNDINSSLRAPAPPSPVIETPLPPQMEGLPPRGPDNPPPAIIEPQPEPEVVVKKARARKPVPVPVTVEAPHETPPEKPKPRAPRRKTAP